MMYHSFGLLFPTSESKLIPRFIPQSSGSAFPLYRGTLQATLQSSNPFSIEAHIKRYIQSKFPPILGCSFAFSCNPAVFSVLRFFEVFCISSFVMISSVFFKNPQYYSRSGCSLIAPFLIDNEQALEMSIPSLTHFVLLSKYPYIFILHGYLLHTFCLPHPFHLFPERYYILSKISSQRSSLFLNRLSPSYPKPSL